MRKIIQHRLATWLERRIPAGKEQTLNHQKIFIFPSRFGFWFLLLCLLLFVLGTNYQNNLMRLLCTFLLSLFFLNLITSYINFSRLRIKAMQPSPSYAGSQGALPLLLSFRQRRAKGIVQLSWWRHVHNKTASVVLDSDPTPCMLPFVFDKRGHYSLSRITLQSDYPMGLFRCWTHLDLQQQVTVYPKPITCALRTQHLSDGDNQASTTSHSGFDEFDQLREYQATDSISSVAWKQAARSPKWVVKTFAQPVSSAVWLTMKSTSKTNLEEQLGEITYQVIQLHKQNQVFGLAIPGIKLGPDSGENHLHECLGALAMFKTAVYS